MTYDGLARIKTPGEETVFDIGTFDAAERRQEKAREAVRKAAYDAGRAAGKASKSRSVPIDFAAGDQEWFRGYDDGARHAGFYWIEVDGKPEPARWTGDEWELIGDDVPHAAVYKVICEADPDAGLGDYC